MPAKIDVKQINTTDGTIATINAGDASSEGSGSGVAKRDHQHAVATGTPTGTVEIADSGSEGVSSDLARADHIHPVGTPAAPANVTKETAAAGTSAVPARADHKHDVSTGSPVELTDSTNAEGAATSLARSNHTHAHGNRSGGSLHSVATPSVSGFLSSTDKTKLDALITPNLVDPKNAVRALENSGNVALTGNVSVGGVTTAPGERVAVFAQSTPTENGIYVTDASAWSRTDDFAAGSSQGGAVIPVNEGTHADSLFKITNDPPNDVVGTSTLAAVKFASGTPRGAGAGLVLNANDLDIGANADGSITVNTNDIQVGTLASDTQHGSRGGGTQHAAAVAGAPGTNGFITGVDQSKLDGIEAGATKEVPQVDILTTENINTDTSLTDTLTAAPKSLDGLVLELNGICQIRGAGQDYTVAGTTITWLASTGTAVNMSTNDSLVARYNT